MSEIELAKVEKALIALKELRTIVQRRSMGARELHAEADESYRLILTVLQALKREIEKGNE